MSSLNDTSDYNTSTVFSETIDEAGTAGGGSRAEGQDSLSPSRNTASETDLITGSFMDEDETLYDDYTTGYDSKTYYSRTFDTRTYDDSSFPQSPLSDELSSTFASFYMDNEVARKVRSTLSFLRRPLIFFSLVLSGSGGIGAVCRVVHAITNAATQRHVAQKTSALNDLYTLPEGYPNVPEWMHQARLGIPSAVERVVKNFLHTCGIPAMADLQKDRWTEALGNLKNAKKEIFAQTTQVISGPMVPLVVFLPLFSLSVITIARRMVARRQARQREDEEYHLMEVENGDGIPLLRSSEFSVIPGVEESNISVEDMIGVEGVKRNGVPAEPEPLSTATNASSFLKGRFPLNPPSEDANSPHTVPASRDFSPVSTTDGDALKASNDVDRNGKDPAAAPPVTLPARSITVAPYAFKGDVSAALVGTPTAKEVNVLLTAASRYNCRRVIVPSSVPRSALVSVVPSLSIERTDDVMQYVMNVEESRGATTVAVFLRPITDDTVELSLYNHPSKTVYVFSAASGVDEDLVSHLVDDRIYTTSSMDEVIPANTCFYDRSVKERNGTIDVGNGKADS